MAGHRNTMSTRLLRRLLGAAAACCALLGAPVRAADITVSAAASLGDALREMAPLFEAAHPGSRLQLNFAASGALLQQMARGAPVDVFASADQETMDLAEKQGLVRQGRRDFATNTLVLVVPAAAARVPRVLADLTQPAYARIAIGLPGSVPVGRYAKAALEAAGLWTTLEPRTVGAHTPRQALDYVARAEADAAFVYATDAAAAQGRVRLAFPVPTPTAIRYPVAPLAAAPNAAGAQRFVGFLFTPAAQAVLARHGFGKP